MNSMTFPDPAPGANPDQGGCPEAYLERYRRIRAWSLELCAPLEIEDYVVQSMPDASPAKWHLAHTTWFFETFVLEPHETGFRPFDRSFRVLFNSYYNAVGEQFNRPDRGLLSRPTVARTKAYRADVDARIERLLASADAPTWAVVRPVLEIGLHHEQQHQELMLTDLKHVFSVNPLHPVFRPESSPNAEADPSALHWCEHAEGLRRIGHPGEGFAYDNESPRHRVFLESFAVSSRLVTCGEFQEFMRDGGYERPELWLSAGWATIGERRWQAPAYWLERDGCWWIFTLSGLRRPRRDEPVCHVSYFEADAFARWSGARLPLESEWEVAAEGVAVSGNFVEDGRWHPAAPGTDGNDETGDRPRQMFGDVWEWTTSPYVEYPGFAPAEGALGEYNGKFMCNQMVLRGGSCATPRSHIRRTYRNFFPPDARWQFSGFRLAR